MTLYLTIITTVLVITQIIRIAQNAINLRNQNNEVKQAINDLERMNPTVDDFETQREAMRLIVWYLSKKQNEDMQKCIAKEET